MTWAPNMGQGHVYVRPDGVQARCGGPPLCSECAREQAEFEKVKANTPGVLGAEPNDWMVPLDLRTDAGRNAAFMYAGAIERAVPEAAEALRARIQRFAQVAR